MAPKRSKQYNRTSKARKASAVPLGALNLSPNDKYEMDDLAGDEIGTSAGGPKKHAGEQNQQHSRKPAQPVNSRKPPQVMEQIWSDPPEPHACHQEEEIPDTFLNDLEGEPGGDLLDVDAGPKFVSPRDVMINMSSSPHTLLERSYLGSAVVSTHSQRTVAVMGDDFGEDEPPSSNAKGGSMDEGPGPTQLEPTTKLPSTTPATKPIAMTMSAIMDAPPSGHLLGSDVADHHDADDPSSPEKPPNPVPPRLLQKKPPPPNQASQDRRAKQSAKVPFGEHAVSHKLPTVKKPVPKPTKPAASKPSNVLKQAPPKTKSKASKGTKRDPYDDFSEDERRPSKLKATTVRKAATEKALKTTESMKRIIGTKELAVVNTSKDAQTSGKKRQTIDDEEYTPAKHNPGTAATHKNPKRQKVRNVAGESPASFKRNTAKETLPKKLKLHQLMETGNDKTPSPWAAQGYSSSAKAKPTSKKSKPPIVITSDPASDSDRSSTSMSPRVPASTRRKTSVVSPHIVEDQVVAVECIGLPEFLNENSLRKPQLVSFGPDGPRNMGRRSPQKRQMSQAQAGSGRKLKRPRTEAAATAVTSVPVQQVPESLDEHEAWATEDDMGTPLDHDENAPENISQPATQADPDAELLSLEPVNLETTSVAEIPQAAPVLSRLVSKTIKCKKPLIKSSHQPPVRRSSRVDETGSPGATMSNFPRMGAPEKNEVKPSVDGFGNSSQRKPPPEFRISLARNIAQSQQTLEAANMQPTSQAAPMTLHEPRRDALRKPTYHAEPTKTKPPTTAEAISSTDPNEAAAKPFIQVTSNFKQGFKEALVVADQGKKLGPEVYQEDPQVLQRTQKSNTSGGGREEKGVPAVDKTDYEGTARRPRDGYRQGRVPEVGESNLRAVVPAIIEIFLEKLRHKEGVVEEVPKLYASNGNRLVNELNGAHRNDQQAIVESYDRRRRDFIAKCDKTLQRMQSVCDALDQNSAAQAVPDRRKSAVEHAMRKLREAHELYLASKGFA